MPPSPLDFTNQAKPMVLHGPTNNPMSQVLTLAWQPPTPTIYGIFEASNLWSGPWSLICTQSSLIYQAIESNSAGFFRVFVVAPYCLKLTWAASVSPEVVGYNIYYGIQSGVYTTEISAGDVTNITIRNLTGGLTYYFAATAVNSEGLQSGFNTQLTNTIALVPAVNLRKL